MLRSDDLDAVRGLLWGVLVGCLLWGIAAAITAVIVWGWR